MVSALLTAASGLIFFVLNLIVALRLSDTTGDRWIPVFRVGQLIGQIAFLVGMLGIVIVFVKDLIGNLRSKP
jgi:TRAP-type C4-dicarboxylate transport system permease small subunit